MNGNGAANGNGYTNGNPYHHAVHQSAAAPVSYPTVNAANGGYNVAQTAAIPTANGGYPSSNGHELHIKTEQLDDTQSLGENRNILPLLFSTSPATRLLADSLMKAVCTAFAHAHMTHGKREKRELLKTQMMDPQIELEYKTMVKTSSTLTPPPPASIAPATLRVVACARFGSNVAFVGVVITGLSVGG